MTSILPSDIVRQQYIERNSTVHPDEDNNNDSSLSSDDEENIPRATRVIAPKPRDIESQLPSVNSSSIVVPRRAIEVELQLHQDMTTIMAYISVIFFIVGVIVISVLIIKDLGLDK